MCRDVHRAVSGIDPGPGVGEKELVGENVRVFNDGEAQKKKKTTQKKKKNGRSKKI